MRRVYILTFSLALITLSLLFLIQEESVRPHTQQQKTGLTNIYRELPLFFIENRGQVDSKVKFYEKGTGHSTYFTKEGIYITLSKKNSKPEVVKITPLGANPKTNIEAEDKLSGKVNYFKGKDPKNWRTNIPTYGKVRYREVYEGIDLVFYGNQRRLEYDVVVKPGVDPGVVRFSYEGVKELKVNDRGELLAVLLSGREVIQKKPYVYQEIGGKKKVIEGEYVVNREGDSFVYTFRLGPYDERYALFIDPVLSYSTYLGGSSGELGRAITVDNFGNAYVTGSTNSTDFPLMNEYDNDCGTDNDPNTCDGDPFITKFDPSGNLLYSTYIDVTDDQIAWDIAVDGSGNIYITGNNGFIIKLNPSGDQVLYWNYLANLTQNIYNTAAFGLAVDDSGNAYITGNTWESGVSYAFVAKIDTNQQGQNSLIYLRNIGNDSTGYDIAIDGSGNAYVTGHTVSPSFPTMNAYDSTCGDNSSCDSNKYDAFVVKLDPNGNTLYATYLGGNGDDIGYGIAADDSGVAYITGETRSSTFPTTPDALDSDPFSQDAFITKIDTTKSEQDSLVYSSYLGGNGTDAGRDIALDSSKNIYIVGFTTSTDLPVTDDAYQDSLNGIFLDVFLVKINSTGSSIIYLTYFGGSGNEEGWGIAVDNSNSIYITGHTQSTDFPLKNENQSERKGLQDAFVAKFSEPNPTHTLTVNKTGTGSGTVTSNPAGINCGVNCTAQFNVESSVTLNATPDTGSTFTGWGGDCASCDTNVSCQIVMYSDKTCTANFDSSSSSIPDAECGNITVNIQGGLFKEGASVMKNLPQFPINATAPCGAVNFTVHSVTGSITVSVTFPNIPPNALFYKLVNGNYHDVNSVVSVNGNTVSLTVNDNGIYDSNTNSGEITDPLVMLVPDSGGGDDGGCSLGGSSSPTYLLILLTLTVVHLLRRYKV
ncbi:beta-propeller repeat-containing protein [Hydrogenivirga caldilitoris]|uniref:Beta-propeller repeat-containing protein n=1 Tax=Hydrogenivirga caldilitoris TaxID=246264 RepID=A0A497XR48_9AQUI|nr:SBBP repeat-containing protein [Hydrogenivirga caldilitoris]RLJ70761.1 beta-propeller repeat-containing protein [Hydrogenivirga caldilitoris]